MEEVSEGNPIQEKLDLLKKWEPAKQWLEVAEKVEGLINKWQIFWEIRQSQQKESAKLNVINYTWIPKNIHPFADALKALNLPNLKESADNSFQDLCRQLNEKSDREHKPYTSCESEEIESEIQYNENLLTMKEEDTHSTPNTSMDVSMEEVEHEESLVLTQEENAWKPPGMPEPMSNNQQATFLHWYEAKSWKEIVTSIQEEMEVVNGVLSNLDKSVGELETLKQRVTALTIGSTITQEIVSRVQETAKDADQMWHLKGSDAFSSAEVTLQAVEELKTKVSSQTCLPTPRKETEEPSSSLNKREQDYIELEEEESSKQSSMVANLPLNKEDKTPVSRVLFSEKKEDKKEKIANTAHPYFYLVMGVMAIGVTALLLSIKSSEFSTWIGRQTRYVN